MSRYVKVPAGVASIIFSRFCIERLRKGIFVTPIAIGGEEVNIDTITFLKIARRMKFVLGNEDVEIDLDVIDSLERKQLPARLKRVS